MLARRALRQQQRPATGPRQQRQLRRSLDCSAAAAPASVERLSLAAPGTSQRVEGTRIVTGCWQLAGGHGREVFEGVQDKLWSYAEAGFTSFDTADIYGPSESILGEFAARWREAGDARELQLFTKFVPNIFNSRPTPASVEAAVRRSLASLRVDSLDLVQMHWWDYGVPGMVDAAKSLADLQAKGLIKQVGLTNMDVDAISSIVDAGVPVANNQVQFSLLDRRPLNGMVQYCAERGIKVFAYGALAGGLLSDRYVEEPKKGLLGQARYSNVDLNTSSLKMYWNVAKLFGGQQLWRDLLAVLHRVAQKHGSSVANVALAWVMRQGGGATVLPIVGLHSRGTSHVEENRAALALALDQTDLESIEEVLQRATGPNGDIYSFERGG